MDTVTTQIIGQLEAASLRAWPPAERVERDGWVMGFSGGYTGRANSVYPLAPGEGRIEARVEWCRAQYAARGLSARFKLTAASQPPALDDCLDRLGYERATEISVQRRGLARVPPHRTAGVRQCSPQEWFALRARMGVPQAACALLAQIVGRMEGRLIPLVQTLGQAPVCSALGHVLDGRLWIFSLMTVETHRRRGHARALLRALLARAARARAPEAWLQVVADNAPARALYGSLGFTHAYTYWYRTEPDGDAPS
jgi:GNAT superfamily N-acetyltransferase